MNRNGDRVNESGYRIDEEGNVLSHDGIELDENLHYKLDFVPFLDDEGNEIDPPDNKPKETKKRRGRPPKKTVENPE